MTAAISVGRLAPGNQWDHNLLDQLFANKLYPTGLEFCRIDGYPDGDDGCVLLIPGRYWAGREDEISAAVSQCSWLLMIVTSDEESKFDIGKVDHPSARFWVQTPRMGRDYPEARLIPLGFPSHFNNLGALPPEKSADLFISAQRTHARRVQCFEALARSRFADNVHPTAGFTQGMKPADYAEAMCAARVAPCPSGPMSADTFRVYEALATHTVPIADDYSPLDGRAGYWERMLPGCPVPILTDYEDLPGYIDDVLADWPQSGNRVAAWWMRYKRSLARWLREDLEWLGALDG